MYYTGEIAALRETGLNGQMQSEVHKIFLAHVGCTPEKKQILDIGTGNGYILSEIEKEYPQKYGLNGIDLSLAMLEQAKKRLGNVANLYCANNFQLPFEDSSFATVTAKNVTMFSPAQIARVLEKEGRFIFREYGVGKGLLEIAALFPKRVIRAYPAEDYATKLAHAGFNEVQLQKFALTKEYTLDQLIQTIQLFPFIEDLSEADLEKIKKYFGDKEKINLTSDPFIIVAGGKK